MLNIAYIVQSQFGIITLYLLYLLFLNRRIGYSYARGYLMLIVPIALVLPLLKIPALFSMPQVEALQTLTLPQVETVVPEPANPMTYLTYIYIAGGTLMMLWSLLALLKLLIAVKKGKVERIDGAKVIFSDQSSSAFSAFGYIFISQAFRNEENLPTLIAHEKCHVAYLHTMDLLLVNIARIVFWFNPAVWHIANLTRQIHEYQADEKVIGSGYSISGYLNLLIRSEVNIYNQFTNQLSYSLTKKRMKMLAKKQKTQSGRLLLSLPVIGILLLSFSVCTAKSADKNEAYVESDNEVAQTQKADEKSSVTIQINGTVGTIKKVEVKDDKSSISNVAIYVDGTLYTKDINDIDVEQVASISVIKSEKEGECDRIMITTKSKKE